MLNTKCVAIRGLCFLPERALISASVDVMEDDPKCFRHHDAECDICPYYEYTVEWEHGKRTGRFWVGQQVRLEWGHWGDGISLIPRNQGPRLNNA